MTLSLSTILLAKTRVKCRKSKFIGKYWKKLHEKEERLVMKNKIEKVDNGDDRNGYNDKGITQGLDYNKFIICQILVV